MTAKTIVVLVTAAVLLFLLIYPAVCLHAEVNIDSIKEAIREKDDARALKLYGEKLALWDEKNTLILAFTPHAETEDTKDFIIELKHCLERKEYEKALEKADLLYARIDHLIEGTRLSWKNIF